MPTGALTAYLDVAQVCLYAFWIFFAGLVFYLRREDRREGYPLVSDWSDDQRALVYWPPPPPKTFKMPHGVVSSGRVDRRELNARPTAPWPGAPLRPVGNPLLDGIGPAAWADREDVPEMTSDGLPLIVPLRAAPAFAVEERDPDPRGMAVVGADGAVGGTVTELWVDRAEPQIRYLEVEVAGPRRVLVPMTLARVHPAERQVRVASILGRQFADVPGLKSMDQVTKLEEDRVSAYYGGGNLYAVPSRSEPLL